LWEGTAVVAVVPDVDVDVDVGLLLPQAASSKAPMPSAAPTVAALFSLRIGCVCFMFLLNWEKPWVAAQPVPSAR
jgi:hypothetical protein